MILLTQNPEVIFKQTSIPVHFINSDFYFYCFFPLKKSFNIEDEIVNISNKKLFIRNAIDYLPLFQQFEISDSIEFIYNHKDDSLEKLFDSIINEFDENSIYIDADYFSLKDYLSFQIINKKKINIIPIELNRNYNEFIFSENNQQFTSSKNFKNKKSNTVEFVEDAILRLEEHLLYCLSLFKT